MVYWEGFTDPNEVANQASFFQLGVYQLSRIRDEFTDIDLFRADGTIDWTDALQGAAGTCVIKAAMGSLSQFPDLVRNAFVNQQLNQNGIINVRFFIRGKPWVVSVDDTMVFYSPSVVNGIDIRDATG